MDAFVCAHLCVFTSMRLINHKFTTNTSLQMMCQHTTADLSTSPPVRNPAAPIIWTLIGWRHGMQLGGKACACVYACACGSLVIQQGFQLSEGKSWVREQLPNQRSASSTVGQWHASQASASQWWMYWLMLHRRAHTLPHRHTLL